MAKLTIDEKQFSSEGYAVFPSAFDIAVLRDALYQLIEADLQVGTIRNTDDSLRPKNILKLGAVRDFIASPKVWDVVKALFPSDPVLCSLGANCVMPGAPGMGIHKDYPYFSRQKQSIAGPLLCAQLILSLDGMTEENGATTVFPGSHRGALAKPLRLTCDAGTLVLFHGALMHGVEPNRSKFPRTNLLASFAPHWVRPFSDLISERHPDDLIDPAFRHLLGLDFTQRVAADVPYAGFGKSRMTA